METDTQTSSSADLEEWFLVQLAAEDFSFDPLLNKIHLLYESDQAQLADSMAELLQDALLEKDMGEQAFLVLEVRAINRPKDRDFLKKAGKAGLKMLGNSPENRALFKNVGFGTKLGGDECFRRLDVLRHLAPGVKCYDKTWGFGVVRGIDHFYERVEIDFESKKEHEMSFAYAGETLVLIDDGHILAMKHDRPDELEALIKKNPAEVVRIALRNYGSLPIQILQEHLIPAIISDGQWKRFWDGARKELKNDPLFEIPVKRTDPIRILHKEKAYDSDWFADFAMNNNMASILELSETMLEEGEGKDRNDAEKAVLGDRLAFTVKGAGSRQPDVAMRAVLAADDFGVDLADLKIDSYAGDLYSPDLFVASMEALGVKNAKRLLNLMAKMDSDRALNLWLGLLPVLDASAVGEVVELLVAQGYLDDCRQAMKLLVGEQSADVDALLWMWRNQELYKSWELGTMPELLDLTMKGIEKDHVGSQLRAQNQIREYFKQTDWIRSVMEPLTEKEQVTHFLRLKGCSAWPQMELRSILAKYIKAYPDLEKLMRDSSGEAMVKTVVGPQTAERSYIERQLLLERIKNEDIPNNSKEIGIARSYGDLKENHEFKAAKEMQGILMRREAELEQMLGVIRPTDFANVRTDEVTMGTGVKLSYPDGRSETYFILGVWDRDEELNIISCETKMAESLIGHAPGAEVEVPTEEGVTMCKVDQILTLPENIRAWIKTEPKPEESAAKSEE